MLLVEEVYLSVDVDTSIVLKPNYSQDPEETAD